MPLYNPKDLLKVIPKKGGFAVGAFNVHNMEYVQAVVRAAELEDAPVILMIGELIIPFAGLDMLAAICKHAARNSCVPVAITLDHGRKEENISRCIELGISVMFDGSHYTFDDNVKLTKDVVERCHKAGLSVEGELGSIGGSEDGKEARPEMMTNPDAAAEFVNMTNVDMLAISIGNCHGLYKKPPRLDVERLKAIREKVDVPIVLHGGSDLPVDMSLEVIREGIVKFNVGTDLKYTFSRTLKEVLNMEPMPFQPPHVLDPAREAVCEVARQKIRLFGSSGKASLYK